MAAAGGRREHPPKHHQRAVQARQWVFGSSTVRPCGSRAVLTTAMGEGLEGEAAARAARRARRLAPALAGAAGALPALLAQCGARRLAPALAGAAGALPSGAGRASAGEMRVLVPWYVVCAVVMWLGRRRRGRRGCLLLQTAWRRGLALCRQVLQLRTPPLPPSSLEARWREAAWQEGSSAEWFSRPDSLGCGCGEAESESSAECFSQTDSFGWGCGVAESEGEDVWMPELEPSAPSGGSAERPARVPARRDDRGGEAERAEGPQDRGDDTAEVPVPVPQATRPGSVSGREDRRCRRWLHPALARARRGRCGDCAEPGRACPCPCGLEQDLELPPEELAETEADVPGWLRCVCMHCGGRPPAPGTLTRPPAGRRETAGGGAAGSQEERVVDARERSRERGGPPAGAAAKIMR